MNREGKIAELRLPYEGEDVEDREELKKDLRRALSALGVSGLIPAARVYLPPKGRRSYESAASAITVALTSATTLRLVIHTIRTWLIEKNRHSVKIEIDGRSIEITGGSEESQRAQVEKFLALFGGQLDSAGPDEDLPA